MPEIVVFVAVVLALLAASYVLQAAEMPREALKYRNRLIQEARYAFGMDAPVAALAGQIHQESSWNPEAKSRYASGLAQFTPATATWISGVYSSLGPAAPLDPGWALRAMVAYDKRLHDGVTVADTECDRWSFALSDYNGGTGRRLARQRLSTKPWDYATTSVINPGISLANQAENAAYPLRIMRVWQPLYRPWGGQYQCGDGE